MTHRPGQLTRDLAGLQRPAGVVHFASSDNASLWGGFVDGAIESGLRESQRSSHRPGRPSPVTQRHTVGITSRPAFDPAPAGLVCRRPVGRWSRFLAEAASSGGTGTSGWNLRATRGRRVNRARPA